MDKRAKIINIIAGQAFIAPEEVDETRSLVAIGVDSMGVVEVIFAIEEEFDVHIPFNANLPEAEAFGSRPVAGLIDYVCALIEQKS